MAVQSMINYILLIGALLGLASVGASAYVEYKYLKYPIDKANIPSQKLAEKLGGKVEDEYITTSE